MKVSKAVTLCAFEKTNSHRAIMYYIETKAIYTHLGQFSGSHHTVGGG
jgi:hypothetical protein